MLSEAALQNLRDKFYEELIRRGYVVERIGVIVETQPKKFDLIGWGVSVPMVTPDNGAALRVFVECFNTIVRTIL